MLTNVIKMYTETSGVAAAVVESSDDCVIQGVTFNVGWRPSAVNQSVQLELSFASTAGFTSNDTRASFAGMLLGYANIAAGTGGQCGWNESLTGLLVPVAAGERIYLHTAFAGTACIINAWLYCIGKMSTRMSDRRRA